VGPPLKAQNAAYAKVQRLQLELGKAQEELDALALSTADSVAFIRGLEQKLQALNDADLVAKHVGDIQFLYCPACYAPIEKNENPHACHLCKTPFDSEHAKTRIVAMINETAVQLRQSRVLQENRTVRMEELQARNRKTQEEWQVASSELAQLRRLPSTEVRERLRELQRKAGYLQRQLEDLENRTRLIELVDELSKRKAALEDSIRRLQTRNEQLRHAQAQRLARAYTLIADEIRKLLHNDLPRELSFEKARNIEFDFVTNKISVDGETYFSASSRVILKSSFFVGFLAAATKEPFLRHPRFCMIDTVEDKGMEPIRSHNFQKEIVRISEQSIADHQIIYATSMIAPQFDAPQFTIGKASTHESRTLNIGQIGPSAAQ
jgi:hypothetical protein